MAGSATHGNGKIDLGVRVPRLAHATGVPASSLRYAIEKGALRAKRIGRNYYVERASAAAYLGELLEKIEAL